MLMSCTRLLRLCLCKLIYLRIGGLSFKTTCGVQWNDIHVAFAPQRLQQAAEVVRHLGFVVHAIDERPLKGHSALLRVDVLAASVNELRNGVAAVDGHDGAPRGVAGFVKRHRERKLLGLVRQLADARR